MSAKKCDGCGKPIWSGPRPSDGAPATLTWLKIAGKCPTYGMCDPSWLLDEEKAAPVERTKCPHCGEMKEGSTQSDIYQDHVWECQMAKAQAAKKKNYFLQKKLMMQLSMPCTINLLKTLKTTRQ